MSVAAVPTLRSIQNYVYRLKKREVAGVQLITREQLHNYCRQFQLQWDVCRQIALNPTAAYVRAHLPNDFLCIPQHAASHQVDGACFTGPRQINWISQLTKLDHHFVLHIDGKYKLHHGIWVLITLGSHCLRAHGVLHKRSLTTTFVPLVYLFCKDNETTGACSMIANAANTIALKCFGKKLVPGALVSDHSDGARAGLRSEWAAPHAQCWPHLIRKFREGAFCSKKHPHYEDVEHHLHAIHNAQSDGMRDLLSIEVGKVWDTWPAKWRLNSLWNEYMVPPWDNWSIGSFDCMLCTPSQQAQESWHKQLLQSRIPGMFKGSTESVFHVALPKLVNMDAMLIPDVLLFHVPTVPADVMDRGLWYVNHEKTHILRKDNCFYMLASDCKSVFKRVDEKLVSQHASLMRGEIPRGANALARLLSIASSIHTCHTAEGTARRAVSCEYNKAMLVCTCKSCRAYGICDHILAANHILGCVNLVHLQTSVSGEKRRRGGYNKGVRPGLVRETQASSNAKRRRRAPQSFEPWSPPEAREQAAAPALSSTIPTPPTDAPPTATAPEEENALQRYIAETLAARERRAVEEAAIRERESIVR